MNLFKYLILFVFLTTPLAISAQETHPFTALDLVRMKRIGDVQVSPNGRYAAFVLRTTDMAEDRYRADIWLVDLEDATRPPMQLTTHAENDAAPKWSKDSRTIYFLSDRSESSQVWRIPVFGGEAAQVTDFPVDVETFRLSPGNDTLAFTASVYPGCQRLSCSANRQTIEGDDLESGIVYDKLIIRFWDAWRDGRRSQLFAAPLKNGRVKNGQVKNGQMEDEPINLTRDIEAAVPAYPFTGDASYTFTGEGDEIIFSTKIRDENESWSVNSDLYRVRIDGKRRPENLTRGNPASDEHPIISPDGRWLAWLATEGPTRWAAPNRIKLMNLKTGDIRIIPHNWDYSPTNIAFSAGSDFIYAASDFYGERVLWRISPDLFAPEVIASGGRVEGFSVGPKGVVFTRSGLAAPADLYFFDGNDIGQITHVNADALAAIQFGDYQRFDFEGARGETVSGYVVMPVGYSDKRTYPVAFIIHGGPHGSMGNSFHYRWNPQTYAGAGYAVVFIDFHGSTGYGAAFTESIRNDRGGATMVDLQKGLAAALNRYPWMDGDRVCALGGSFGGYMVNLIAGVWQDRFRCLVSHDGMFDNRMKYFSGDIIGYLEEGFGGLPYFEDPASHEKFNPVNHVANWQTPIMVIHSELDYRVPITQGIGAFTAAQRKGIPSRFLYFPDENHWVLKPNNSVQWHREVIRWLDQWLKR